MRVDRGIVTGYDATNHKADVLLVGSLSRVALGVPVADHIPPDVMAADKACGLMFFGEGDAGVVVCTFDGTPFNPLQDLDFDAKGDLLVGKGSDDYDRLAVGSNDQVLTADSAQTLGVKWATPATGAVPTYTQVNTNTAQTLTTGAAQYQNLTRTITVPGGKTYRLLAIGGVVFKLTGGFQQGLLRRVRIRNITDGGVLGPSYMECASQTYFNQETSVTVAGADTITASSTIRVEVWKTVNKNTESAIRGWLTVVFWDAT